MPKDTPQVDHKAQALRLLAKLDEPTAPVSSKLIAAQVHASLAIAEGQDRVAEAIRGRADTWFRQALDEIRALAADQGYDDDGKVRERIFHIADDVLERAEP